MRRTLSFGAAMVLLAGCDSHAPPTRAGAASASPVRGVSDVASTASATAAASATAPPAPAWTASPAPTPVEWCKATVRGRVGNEGCSFVAVREHWLVGCPGAIGGGGEDEPVYDVKGVDAGAGRAATDAEAEVLAVPKAAVMSFRPGTELRAEFTYQSKDGKDSKSVWVLLQMPKGAPAPDAIVAPPGNDIQRSPEPPASAFARCDRMK